MKKKLELLRVFRFLVIVISIAICVFVATNAAFATEYKQGTYSAELSWSGGTMGHNKFESPCTVHIGSNGSITADIKVVRQKAPMRPPSYISMGTKAGVSRNYVTNEENCTQTFYNVPLSSLGKMEISAVTEAMSETKTINYEIDISDQGIPVLGNSKPVEKPAPKEKEPEVLKSQDIKKMNKAKAKVEAYDRINESTSLTEEEKKSLKAELKDADNNESIEKTIAEAEELERKSSDEKAVDKKDESKSEDKKDIKSKKTNAENKNIIVISIAVIIGIALAIVLIKVARKQKK